MPFAITRSLFQKKSCLTSVLFSTLFSVSGNDENSTWSYLGQNDKLQVEIYMRLGGITSDSMLNVDVLFDFDRDNLAFGHKHKSEIETITISCIQHTYLIHNVDWYKSEMGDGAVVFNAHDFNWMEIESASIINQIENLYCVPTA